VARNVKATSRLSEVGAQDIVILALKAHQVEPIAAELPKLFGPDTIVVTTQNGIPWWYFQKHGGEFEGRRVETVDPSGTLMASVEVERILGCVVFPAAEIVAPGVVRVIEGNRFPVGELDGSESERVKMVTALFTKAGFKSPVLKNVRGEIWLKLWGNLSFNPISALTHSTLVDICQFPLTRQLAADMMTEAQTIANKLGIEFRVSLEKRIAGAENVGKHKTSMLQDIEIGRAIEIDALVGAVIELGRLTQTPTPHIDAVYACVKLLAKTLDEEKGKLKIEKIS
jgi:2-dehydropantoate 2-reductase